MLKLVVVLGVGVGLCGCEAMQHTTVAPRALVEGCVQEAYPASGHGWGPMCSSLNEWCKLHNWYFGGGPPNPSPISESEAKALAAK